MPALQVREFPDELYEELRAYAARNRRSIAQQTIACVENEIRRSKALETAESGGEARIADFLPASVREASARAQAIDPFKWLDAFRTESPEAVEARRAKWERLGKEIDELNAKYDFPKQSCEETAQMIREDRDGNHDHLVVGIDDLDTAESKPESKRDRG